MLNNMMGDYGPVTGSICYDQGLDEHSSFTQKSLKNQGKRPFKAKFSSPAARSCEGLRPVSGTPPRASTPVASHRRRSLTRGRRPRAKVMWSFV